jgi:hypothetical protein
MRDLRRLSQFAARLKRKLPEEANRLASQVARQLIIELTEETPVDTGVAVSNWRVITGDMPTGEIYAHEPGYRGSTRSTNIAIAVAIALQYISGKKPGQPIRVVNSAHHIISLNYGTSKQAPAGFIDSAIVRAQLMLRAERLKL